jgi:hypothetical protein
VARLGFLNIGLSELSWAALFAVPVALSAAPAATRGAKAFFEGVESLGGFIGGLAKVPGEIAGDPICEQCSDPFFWFKFPLAHAKGFCEECKGEGEDENTNNDTTQCPPGTNQLDLGGGGLVCVPVMNSGDKNSSGGISGGLPKPTLIPLTDTPIISSTYFDYLEAIYSTGGISGRIGSP